MHASTTYWCHCASCTVQSVKQTRRLGASDSVFTRPRGIHPCSGSLGRGRGHRAGVEHARGREIRVMSFLESRSIMACPGGAAEVLVQGQEPSKCLAVMCEWFTTRWIPEALAAGPQAGGPVWRHCSSRAFCVSASSELSVLAMGTSRSDGVFQAAQQRNAGSKFLEPAVVEVQVRPPRRTKCLFQKSSGAFMRWRMSFILTARSEAMQIS